MHGQDGPGHDASQGWVTAARRFGKPAEDVEDVRLRSRLYSATSRPALLTYPRPPRRAPCRPHPTTDPGSRRNAQHPAQEQPALETLLQQAALPRAQPHRALLLHAEALPPCRHPLRQARRQLRPSAQLALVVTLSDRHTSRTQDVVGGDGVEMEVG